MNKHVLAPFGTLALCFALAACGGAGQTGTEQTTGTDTTTEPTTTETTTTTTEPTATDTTTTTTGAAMELADTYVDQAYGFSFQAPEGGSGSTEEGKIELRWTSPYTLWVNAYAVENNPETTIDQVMENLTTEYDATVVEQGDGYFIMVCTDPDGDTNYTKVYVASDILYFMDVYYHPADEAAMHDVAFNIMNSFTY
jgi:hypothetical protein